MSILNHVLFQLKLHAFQYPAENMAHMIKDLPGCCSGGKSASDSTVSPSDAKLLSEFETKAQSKAESNICSSSSSDSSSSVSRWCTLYLFKRTIFILFCTVQRKVRFSFVNNIEFCYLIFSIFGAKLNKQCFSKNFIIKIEHSMFLILNFVITYLLTNSCSL